MDIKDRLYPYPVLSAGTDDYVGSTFTFTAKTQKGVRELRLSFHFNLQDDGLKELIANDMAEFLVHIECGQTCYREIILTQNTDCEKRIPEKELNGKVAVCVFLIANQQLVNYRNKAFNADYGRTAFTIDAGSILAIGGQVDITVTKETEELAKIPSIFTICKYAADTDDFMAFDYYGDKIVIKLSEAGFNNYKIMTNMPTMLTTTHSMIVIPALIYVFETMKQAEDLSDFESHRWFQAIKRTLKIHELEFGKELLEQMPSFELAQRLLDSPINRAMEAIVNLDFTNDEE